MEIAFEYLVAAIEAVRGTAVNPPTRYLNLAGLITPEATRYRPDESRGRLAEFNRSVVVRKVSSFEAEGPADVYTLPLILNSAIKGNVTAPATPGGATDARLWTFDPTMDADDVESLTLYGGDPNVQAFQSAFNLIDELTIKGDASKTDGVTLAIKGMGQYPAKTAPLSLPAELEGPLLTPGKMQVWLDTGTDAIGTTELQGRVISAEFSVNKNNARKWLASGPSSNLGFSKVGRGKFHGELKLVLEVPDLDQYDLFGTDTEVKARVRFNGPEIETGFYHYVQVDAYGPADGFAWGENEGTNRTIELTILTEYNADAGHDFQILVQNDRDAL